MARYGMLINTKKCVGCYACRLACQAKNHLEPTEAFIKFHEIETGEFPNVYNEIVPTQCQHCEDAPCAAVCPTHATYVTDSGVVEKCRFCWENGEPGNPPACVGTCISGARVFGDLDDPESDISQAIAQYHAQPLASNLTASKIYYVR